MGGGDSHPLEGGVVHLSLVDSEQDQTQKIIMGDCNPDLEAANAAAELAAAQAGWGE